MLITKHQPPLISIIWTQNHFTKVPYAGFKPGFIKLGSGDPRGDSRWLQGSLENWKGEKIDKNPQSQLNFMIIEYAICIFLVFFLFFHTPNKNVDNCLSLETTCGLYNITFTMYTFTFYKCINGCVFLWGGSLTKD